MKTAFVLYLTLGSWHLIMRVLGNFLKIFTFFISITSCQHSATEPTAITNSEYPKEIASIMINSCATDGCHNTLSYQNAGGLLLDKWENLFKGGNSGASIIPYSSDFSPLLFFINTHSELGVTAIPTMPYNRAPLTKDEYIKFRDWVKAGAPNKEGKIAFSSNPSGRQKVYMSMQGCDLIAVVDAEKKVVMRYIPIGKSSAIEAPHCVRVSTDGQFAYVSFLSAPIIQKINTTTDTVVDEYYIGNGSWNVFLLSPDGKKMMVSDWAESGKLVLLNLETKIIEATIPTLNRPHGIQADEAFEQFYVTSESKNVIYKFNIKNGTFKEVSIGNDLTSNALIHEIMMTPDRSKYFITCQNLGQIRVMDAQADTLIKIIPVGLQPQEIALSKSKPLMLITCTEDNSSFPNAKGSVYVINYLTYETTRIDAPLYQPHAITIDDVNQTFYVLSRNANPNGPAPHHSSSCSGRNGFYHTFDLNTLQRQPKKYEVTVEPYSADIRFKP